MLQRHDATYPDIRAVFWVASSQNTEDLFELPLVGDTVDIYVVFVRCHCFNIIVSRTQKTQRTPGLCGKTVLTYDCSGREFELMSRGGSDVTHRQSLRAFSFVFKIRIKYCIYTHIMFILIITFFINK